MHILKTINPYFNDVSNGLKDFEIRINDRNFKVGDTIKLVEYEPYNTSINPRYLIKKIKYILNGGMYGLEANYVIIGMENI